MVGREHSSRHRASTNLELLFDLTFVVAVAQAAHALAEHLIEGRVGAGVEGYLSVFFALWWAWVNFTWFASAFDTDDVPYRLLTLLQMSGVLVLAAGVPNAFDGNFTAVTVGYVVMRVAMIAQWLRAARPIRSPASPACATPPASPWSRSAGWLGWPCRTASGGPASCCWPWPRSLVPYWAERPGMTSWHPAHIAERYGLFTIIVLGEGISQAGLAIQTAFTADGVTPRLVVTAVEGLVLLFAMWWIYFARESGDALRERTQLAFFWGYGHYLVFASAAAVAAGIDVAITALNARPGADHEAGVHLSHVVIAFARGDPGRGVRRGAGRDARRPARGPEPAGAAGGCRGRGDGRVRRRWRCGCR